MCVMLLIRDVKIAYYAFKNQACYMYMSILKIILDNLNYAKYNIYIVQLSVIKSLTN